MEKRQNNENSAKHDSNPKFKDLFKFPLVLGAITFVTLLADPLRVILQNNLHDFLNSSVFLQDIMYFGILIISIIINRTVPTKFYNLIALNNSIFFSEAIKTEFLTKIKSISNQKRWITISLTMGFLWTLSFISVAFAFDGLNFVAIGNNTIRPATDFDFAINVIVLIVLSIALFFLGYIMVHAIIQLIVTFYLINKLGTEDFPLKITYTDLKIGTLNEIGKFIISICIPVLIFCTIVGIIGNINLNRELAIIAYGEMILGIIFTVLFSFLLYKSTIHIHNSISKFKIGLQNKITISIENELTKDENCNFDLIYKANQAYEDVNDMNDWPFDPKSLKKFLATAMSTVLPLALSFFEIGP